MNPPHSVHDAILNFRVRRIDDLAKSVVVACMAESRVHHETSNGDFKLAPHLNVSLACFLVHIGVVNYSAPFGLIQDAC